MSTTTAASNSPESTNGAEPARKPPKAKKAPQRRSYASELADLQKTHADLESRVGMAVRILKKSIGPDPGSTTNGADLNLVEVAIETLSGE